MCVGGEGSGLLKGDSILACALSNGAFDVTYISMDRQMSNENITSLPCATLFAGNNNSGLIFAVTVKRCETSSC